MYATLTAPCWSPASIINSVRFDNTAAIRRRRTTEVRGVLSEIAASPGMSGHETPVDLPAELHSALDRWIARKAD
jgi:hypothetical protein